MALRGLAAQLSERTGHLVEPVSLLHSHKVDASELDGKPATIVKRRLRQAVAKGVNRIIFLPLFLAPSRAITEYLPELIEEAQAECPELETKIAAPLSGLDIDSPDPRLAEILATHVREAIKSNGFVRPKVVLVDHGSPIETVARVRNAVAGQLSNLLFGEVAQVVASSMERREGEAYAFNEPLLERVNHCPGFTGGELLAAMFFLSPGRHAGPDGDVAEILGALSEGGAYEKVTMTKLIGEHPLLLEVLSARLDEVLA